MVVHAHARASIAQRPGVRVGTFPFVKLLAQRLTRCPLQVLTAALEHPAGSQMPPALIVPSAAPP